MCRRYKKKNKNTIFLHFVRQRLGESVTVRDYTVILENLGIKKIGELKQFAELDLRQLKRVEQKFANSTPIEHQSPIRQLKWFCNSLNFSRITVCSHTYDSDMGCIGY